MPTDRPTTGNRQVVPARAREMARGLFTHQISGIAFLLARRRAILADDMGLGKTRQSILALREAQQTGPYLVVCPASVKSNWRREIEQVLGKQTPVVVVGGKVPVSNPGFDGWVVINYDILQKHFDDLNALDFVGFVFDEAHYLKNYRSKRSRIARSLIDESSEDAIVHCLTGTPMTNRPRDLFPLLQLVGHPLGKSFLSFAKRYCDAYRNDYGWVSDGASNIEELTVQLHGTMLRRRKEDVLDLPDKIRTWLPVEIPETPWRNDVRRLVADLIAAREQGSGVESDGQPTSKFNLLARLSPTRKRIATAKAKHTVEFVQGIVDQGEKVIVYSCYTPPVTRIVKHFGEAARALTGKTPQHQRQQVVDDFQEDESVRVLVANIIAGGVGVNLTAARTVVFNDLDWVPANHWQAEDRAYRIGQTHTVNVYYFTASDTIDEFVGQVLAAKAELVSAVVEGGALSSEGAATGDVLSELHDLVNRLAPQFEDRDSDEGVDRLLREAAERYRAERAPMRSPGAPNTQTDKRASADSAIRLEALDALVNALSPPSGKRYRIAASGSGAYYTLDVDGSDVTCTCRGFEYRGQCRHARDLKAAIAGGDHVPQQYQEIE